MMATHTKQKTNTVLLLGVMFECLDVWVVGCYCFLFLVDGGKKVVIIIEKLNSKQDEKKKKSSLLVKREPRNDHG